MLKGKSLDDFGFKPEAALWEKKSPDENRLIRRNVKENYLKKPKHSTQG